MIEVIAEPEAGGAQAALQDIPGSGAGGQSSSRRGTQDLIRVVARMAASEIAGRSVIRSRKAEQDLAAQLQREFAACVGYWDLYFASGGERVPKSAMRPRSAGRKSPAIKRLPKSN